MRTDYIMGGEAKARLSDESFNRSIHRWTGSLVVLLMVTCLFLESSYRSFNITTLVNPIKRSITSIVINRNINFFDDSPYSFVKTPNAFGNIDMVRIGEFSKSDFQNLILSSVPKGLRSRLEGHLPVVLKFAEKFQVDPFWVVAVMWTESHFKNEARSYVDARGLMQIMPGTAHFVSLLMKRPVSKHVAEKLSLDPLVNVEMGVFYLNKLQRDFNFNSVLATVAYNMGPARVRWRLKNNRPVGHRNRYLDRVKKAYAFVTQKYNEEISNNPPHHINTYVVKQRLASYIEYQLSSLYALTMPKLVASNSFYDNRIRL